MSCTRPFHGADFSHSLFYLTLLLWTRRMSGLADFSSKMMMKMVQREKEGNEWMRMVKEKHEVL